MTPRPFRFGIVTETFDSAAQLSDLAVRAESLGFDTMLIRDHLAPDYFGPQFAPTVTLGWLAAKTTTLRLGTLVIDNDFRHPTILAKEFASLDRLSGGRIELGIGAGWLRNDYDPAGLQYDRNGVRIDRLEESLQILHGCFNEPTVSFAGSHYQLNEHKHFPAPVQIGGPPILVGAGKPRMLRLAGKYADIVGLLTVSVSAGFVEEDIDMRRSVALRSRIDHVREGADDRFDQIELQIVPDVVIDESRERALDQVAKSHGWDDLDRSIIADMPAIFAGPQEYVIELMHQRREEFGISYYVVSDDQIEVMAPIVEALAG